MECGTVHGGLGRSVHVDNRKTRNRGLPRVHIARLQRFTAESGFAQRGRRALAQCTRACYKVERAGRPVDGGHADTLHLLEQQHREGKQLFRENMAGCTERKGLVQILARKIKVKRRLIAENIMLGVAAELAHPVGEVDDRTVRNDDSLRRTGRTRGEQQVNRVNIQYALTDGLQQVCVSRCCKALVHRDERRTVGERLGLLTVALSVDDGNRMDLLENTADTRFRHVVVNRNVAAARIQHTLHCGNAFGRAADQNRDRLVQRIDGLGKVRAQTLCGLQQLAEGEHAVLIAERRLVRVHSGRGFQIFEYIFSHRHTSSL